jgi:hypothetical protein
MDINEAVKRRHSVRQYRHDVIEEEKIRILKEEIELCNKAGNLNFQLVLNEPRAFDCKAAHYGKFEGVSNYFALVGAKCKDLYEKCGYFGERLVLKAQSLGLHTCWVALTYKKIPEAFSVSDGEKFTVVISVGYGRHRGLPRKSKTPEQVSNVSAKTPAWFLRGVESALLAPTAMNQQKFRFIYNPDGTVSAKATLGFYTKMDLGIAKLHFEIGAGKENFIWK